MGILKDKLSNEQKLEVERLRLFVARIGLTPQMNSTKWRAAIDAIQAVPGYRALYRVKLVTESAEPAENRWLEGFPDHLPLYNSIEWLELNRWVETAKAGAKPKREDFGEALKRELAAVRIPIGDGPNGIRIVAYSRR